METSLTRLSEIELPLQNVLISQAKEIFHQTAGNPRFETENDRAHFENRYFDVYLRTPESFFFAHSKNRALGYLAGAPQTLPLHYQLNPYLEYFRAEIDQTYPAHLHINLSGSARGSGVGSRLIQVFTEQLAGLGVPGVHIITSDDARNVSFYLRNGFTRSSTQYWKEKTLLFMGKAIS
jgi:GNAT superfamily N-acetyltransferase